MLVAKDSIPKGLFGWKKSLKKSHKLVTDATLLENDRNEGDSPDGTQLTALSVSPLSQPSDNQNMSLTLPNGSLDEPPNGALSFSRSEQNIYISRTTGVHIGSNVINHVIQSSSQRSNADDSIEKTRSIAAMMASNQPINKNIMEVISTHLGENWRSLFRSLDFSDGQIDQMKEDYYINGVKEVIYRLLLDYSRNNDHASLGHITKLMWKLGFKKCVKILKKHYKRGDFMKPERPTGSTEASCSKGKSDRNGKSDD